MSATIKLSDKPCCLCKATDNTVNMKLKDGTFQGVVCPKHLYQFLKGGEVNGKPEGK